MMMKNWATIAVKFFVLSILCLGAPEVRAAGVGEMAAASPQVKQQATEMLARAPMHFETVRDPKGRLHFSARGRGYQVAMGADVAQWTLQSQKNDLQKRVPGVAQPLTLAGPPAQPQTARVTMRLVGGNPRAAVQGVARQTGVSNYFLGNDKAQWRTNVDHYARVKYAQVYRGIDLVYYGNQQQLEYDFLVAPHADASQIRLRFEGTRRLEINRRGDLVLHTSSGPVVQRAPVLYQEIDDHKRPVVGRYRVFDAARGEVGFEIGAYDKARALTIDPVVEWSSYVGGNGIDYGHGIAIDGTGHIFITGVTQSTNLPNARNSYNGGSYDAFVSKLDSNGSVVWSTYVGGSDNE